MPSNERAQSREDAPKRRLEPQNIVALYDKAATGHDSAALLDARQSAVEMFERIASGIIRTLGIKKSAEAIIAHVTERLTSALVEPHTADGRHLRRGTYRTVKNRTLNAVRDFSRRPEIIFDDEKVEEVADWLDSSNPYSYLRGAELELAMCRFIDELSPLDRKEFKKILDGDPAIGKAAQRRRAKIIEKANGELRRDFATYGVDNYSEEFAMKANRLTQYSRFDVAMVAFGLACPAPTSEDIKSWSRKFPEFAADFAAHAAVERGDVEHFNIQPEESESSRRPVFNA